MMNAPALARQLGRDGRYGDTIVAHINPREMAMLMAAGGSGTINPLDHLPEFFNPGGGNEDNSGDNPDASSQDAAAMDAAASYDSGRAADAALSSPTGFGAAMGFGNPDASSASTGMFGLSGPVGVGGAPVGMDQAAAPQAQSVPMSTAAGWQNTPNAVTPTSIDMSAPFSSQAPAWSMASAGPSMSWPGPGSLSAAPAVHNYESTLPVSAYNIPVGMQNNNPGNLKFANLGWEGDIGPSQNLDDGQPQSVFSSPEMGMRAMAKNLTGPAYAGVNTISQLAARYTPGNPDVQARNISAATGIDANAPINLHDPDTLATVMTGILAGEQGPAAKMYSPAMVQRGVSLALGTSSSSNPAQDPFTAGVYGAIGKGPQTTTDAQTALGGTLNADNTQALSYAPPAAGLAAQNAPAIAAIEKAVQDQPPGPATPGWSQLQGQGPLSNPVGGITTIAGVPEGTGQGQPSQMWSGSMATPAPLPTNPTSFPLRPVQTDPAWSGSMTPGPPSPSVMNIGWSALQGQGPSTTVPAAQPPSWAALGLSPYGTGFSGDTARTNAYAGAPALPQMAQAAPIDQARNVAPAPQSQMDMPPSAQAQQPIPAAMPQIATPPPQLNTTTIERTPPQEGLVRAFDQMTQRDVMVSPTDPRFASGLLGAYDSAGRPVDLHPNFGPDNSNNPAKPPSRISDVNSSSDLAANIPASASPTAQPNVDAIAAGAPSAFSTAFSNVMQAPGNALSAIRAKAAELSPAVSLAAAWNGLSHPEAGTYAPTTRDGGPTATQLAQLMRASAAPAKAAPTPPAWATNGQGIPISQPLPDPNQYPPSLYPWLYPGYGNPSPIA